LPVQDWSFSSSLAVVALFQVDSAVAAVAALAGTTTNMAIQTMSDINKTITTMAAETILLSKAHHLLQGAVVQAVAAVVVGAVAAAVEENEVFNFRLHLQTFIRFRIKPRSCRMQ
tara:strand:- start:27 stop:371 length:345 start_codon:yes stop_codon:yes gene_type:complete